MSNPIIKLIYGHDTLDLMDAVGGGSGRYKVGLDFRPPTAPRSVVYGSAPRGANVVSKRPENIGFSFSLHIRARSYSEAERARRNVQAFLSRAGGSTPLYLAYRAYNDYTVEPFFGLAGTFARYEILHGDIGPVPGETLYTGKVAFVDMPVNLVIRPQSSFRSLPAGQATGFLFEDYIGRADGLPRGTIISRATTNRYTNPIFMNDAWDTDWTAAGTGFVVSKNTDPEFILFGNVSARCSKSTVAAGDRLTQSVTLAASTQYFSCYIKMIDGSAPTSINLWYAAATIATTSTAVGNGWYRLTATATGTGGAAAAGVSPTANNTTVFFVDGFQVNTTNHTALVHGDLLDCSWDTTKHRSVSSSTAGRLRYDFDDILGVRNGWTMRIAWLPPVSSSGTRYFCEDSDDAIQVYLDSSHRVNVQISASNSVQSAAITVTGHTPIIFHVTYDGSNLTVYQDGTQLVTGSGKTPADALPTWLYIGTDDDAGNHCGGTIMGFATFRSALSSAAVGVDYAQVYQQIADGERIDPLPWVWTEDGDNVIDNDTDGTLYSYCVVGGLMGDDLDLSYKLDSSNTFVLGPGVTWGCLPVEQHMFDKDILRETGTNTLLFYNGTGTVNADANGNAVKRISLSTSTDSSIVTAITSVGAQLIQGAGSVAAWIVAKDTSTNTNVQVQLQLMLGDNQETYFSTPWRTLATSAAFRPFLTPELPLNFEDPILDSQRKMGFRIRLKRTTGASTENFDVSHIIWMVNPTTVYTGDVGATVAVDMAYVRDKVIEVVDDAAPTLTIGRRLFNRPLPVRPDRLNVYFLQHSADNYAASKTTWTTGYNLEVEQFVTTPRFDIY